MPTQRLHKTAGPPACTPTKASKLCTERAQLDAERLEIEREARSLSSRIAAIDDELIRFTKAAGEPPVRELARFTLAVVQAPGFFSYKDNLVAEIGLEEMERRKRGVATKDKLVLTEKVPAARSAAASRTKKPAGPSKGRAA
jgi:hypothetical protein